MTRLAALFVIAAAVYADTSDIPCPPRDRPVADLANVLGPGAEERIAQACRSMPAPLGVVTIRSMAAHGEATTIETFALRLLAVWRYDEVEGDGRDWSRGILFLVSVEDRKCRIELGDRYGAARNAECRTILDECVLPRFRSGDYEGGILAGVDALGSFARGERVVRRKKAGSWAWPIGLVLLGLFSVVSFARRGTNGYAWSFWRSAFSALGWILVALATSRGHRRRRGWGYTSIGLGGFGVSRGGFGGGFRGGGGGRGATGSW